MNENRSSVRPVKRWKDDITNGQYESVIARQSGMKTEETVHERNKEEDMISGCTMRARDASLFSIVNTNMGLRPEKMSRNQENILSFSMSPNTRELEEEDKLWNE